MFNTLFSRIRSFVNLAIVCVLWLLLALTSFGAAIPGSIPITAPIAPTDTADTFPTHLALYGKGGIRTVADNTARDAIPAARRESGMLVHVTGTGRTWRLRDDLTSWAEVDTSQPVVAWDPQLDESMAVDRGTDGATTKYIHDTAAIFYNGQWWYGWNGNVTQTEGIAGQKNMQRRWTDWRTIRNAPITTPFESASESENPIDSNAVSWHPNYWVNPSSGNLENWWFATANSTATNQGFRSVWSTNTSKWTNYKIQIRSDNTVTWSTNVQAFNAEDRLSLYGGSYTPMPLALPVKGNGVWANPVILSSSTGIALGGTPHIAVLRSTDDGANWVWSVGPTNTDAASYRSGVWEPFMTWNGSTWRLFCRNFNNPPIGKAYSVSDSTDLIAWTPWRDAGIETGPMRWQTQPDGDYWIAACVDRPATAAGTESTRRYASALWRTRDGANWNPLGLITRDHGIASYSTPIFPGDGWVYLYGSRGNGGVLSRFRPPPKGLIAFPRNAASQGLDNGATFNANAVLLRSRDYLRKRVLAPYMTNGWTIALAGVPGTIGSGVGLNATRTNTASYGNGQAFSMDSGWGPKFGAIDFFGSAIKWRGYERSFVAVTFDDIDKRMRLAVRNSEGYQQEEWQGVTIYANVTITDGLTATVDGVTYTFRNSPSAATDVKVEASNATTFANWRLVIQTNSPSLIIPTASQWRMDGALRPALLVIKAAPTAANPFGTMTVDGTVLKFPSTVWPELIDGVTLNGNNDSNPRGGNAGGAEVWEFGIWTNRLTTVDFRMLSNEIGAKWGWGSLHLTNEPAITGWASAHHGFSGARGVDATWEGLDSRGHSGQWIGETLSLPGDAAAAVETPVGDGGSWTFWSAAKWDRFPASSGFPLLYVGSHETNIVVRMTNVAGTVSAYIGAQSIALPADTWTEISVSRTPSNVTFRAGGAALTESVATPSKLGLGRAIYTLGGFEAAKRSAQQQTQFRNLRFD